MKVKTVIFNSIALACLLCGAGPVSANLVDLVSKKFGPQPVPLDQAPTADKAVKLDSFEQLKTCKKVVVAGYAIQFITGKKASANAGSDSSDYMNSAHVNSDIKLTGLDNAVFQAITDTCYSNFLAGLKDLGVEVMPYAEYAGQPEYASMKDNFLSSPYEVSGGIFTGGLPFQVFAPTGLPLVHYPDMQAFNNMGMMKVEMTRTAPASVEPQWAKKAGVATVHVYMVVDFCQMEAHGGYFAPSASVDTKPQLSVAKASQISFYFGNGLTGGREYARLKNDGFGTDEFVADLKDVTTSGQKTAAAASEVISLLNGHNNSYRTKSYEAVADPVKYQASCVKYVTATENLILAGLKTKTAK